MFVKTYGDIIDKDVRATIEGRSNIPSNAERGREVGKCLETLLLETVAAINSMLGATWTSSQRQGQGQPAFESKSEPVNHDSRQTSNRALASMFFLLKTCAERCPVFLLHLAAAPGEDRNEDLLLRRALESAVTSLLEPEASTSKSASVFLQATVILTQSSSDDVRNTAEELLSSVKPKIIAALVVGACGKMNAGTLEDAASLLRQILCASASPEEVHSNLGQSSLRSDEYFLLGNSGRAVAVNFLLRSSRNETTDEEVSEFLHSVWELHQIESPEPLEESDAVALFCKKYS